ncbi:CubicO group peptidase (beta-lactamase class C family) [Pseudoduganella lurida]|uniref:CubicO group peptidase (Beta-lactamase class C family) n=1 Tax=Pseudoduganella lurida TaxID=1036180 RepID=A0A562RJH2_9BURK|nr:serine hydrolase domain-containing protein [Pseudoduganella lurida]TWI69219.1 CubicO group peptidase (beta-lactamase class C family) [Pseudoduganella lurida]
MDLRRIVVLAAGLVIGGATLAQQAVQPEAVVPGPAVAAPAGPAMVPAPRGKEGLTKDDVDSWLDGYMPYALNTGVIPGAVVVVVKDGQILTARGFGYADVEHRTPVDPERTLFRPGSVSKLVTWTAVMQQVERGKLDLDTDVNKYLDFTIPALDGAPITLRQIMTHTAGFEEAAKEIIDYLPAKTPKLGALLKAWVPHRIYPAGTTPAYSNYATALAGYVVERISGQPFDDYVEQHVFAPLGMKDASFRQPLPARLAKQMARGYPKAGEEAKPFEIIGPAPAGSLSASGTDMGRFMLGMLQYGELTGQRVLSAQTAATMLHSPLEKVDPRSLIPPLNRMELGFFETNINGRAVVGHLGDTEAFHTSLHLYTKEGVGLYASFNSTGKEGAVGTLRTALFHDFSDRYLPNVAPADGKVDAKTAAEHARLMGGVWENSRKSESNFFALLGFAGQTKVTVTDKGELLIPALVGRGGQPREWVEIAPFVWRDRNGHDRIAAQVVDGKPVRWSMDFMSPFMVFDRVPASRSTAWLTPALVVGLLVLLLTFLALPADWIVRRRYGVGPAQAGKARTATRATRILAGLSLAVLAGWAGLIAAMMASLKYATSFSDPWLWLLQGLGLIIFVGSILASGRHLQLAFQEKRSLWRKLWSILVFASALLLCYFAWQFGLLAFTVHY